MCFSPGQRVEDRKFLCEVILSGKTSEGQLSPSHLLPSRSPFPLPTPFTHTTTTTHTRFNCLAVAGTAFVVHYDRLKTHLPPFPRTHQFIVRQGRGWSGVTGPPRCSCGWSFSPDHRSTSTPAHPPRTPRSPQTLQHTEVPRESEKPKRTPGTSGTALLPSFDEVPFQLS